MKKSRSKPKYNWSSQVQLDDFNIPREIYNDLVDILNIEDNTDTATHMRCEVELSIKMYIAFSKKNKEEPKPCHVIAGSQELHETAEKLLQLMSKTDDLTKMFLFKTTDRLDSHHNVIKNLDQYVGHDLIAVPLSSGPSISTLHHELQTLIQSCMKTYDLLDGKQSKGITEDPYLEILINKLNDIYDEYYMDEDLNLYENDTYEPSTDPKRLKLDFFKLILDSADIKHTKTLSNYLS